MEEGSGGVVATPEPMVVGVEVPIVLHITYYLEVHSSFKDLTCHWKETKGEENLKLL